MIHEKICEPNFSDTISHNLNLQEAFSPSRCSHRSGRHVSSSVARRGRFHDRVLIIPLLSGVFRRSLFLFGGQSDTVLALQEGQQVARISLVEVLDRHVADILGKLHQSCRMGSFRFHVGIFVLCAQVKYHLIVLLLQVFGHHFDVLRIAAIDGNGRVRLTARKVGKNLVLGGCAPLVALRLEGGTGHGDDGAVNESGKELAG